MTAHYAIGIDLGTTNSVLAYAPLGSELSQVQVLPITQLVALGQVEALPSLPSFVYIPTEQERESGVCAVPGHTSTRYVVGAYARSVSATAPGRTVASAKSWLCNPQVDRQSPLLPWEADDDVEKISPLQASTLYLQHLVAEWNRQFPDAPFDQQFVSLTLPASFDMAARELTKQAAMDAGFPSDFVLLEEPQAAVYHWMDKAGDAWRKQVAVGDSLLVCDVGGGTTDLTLVQVDDEHGELQLRRLAVGNHLLVGGDNMDLAMAHFASQRFQSQGAKLNPWQSVSLWHSCRAAKEVLLSNRSQDRYTLSILGRGSRLIGGTISIEVQRHEVEQLLVDGFFPRCELTERPMVQPASGFLQIGLPYESDTSITKHVAAFLVDQGCDTPEKQPKHLLFNGGAFKAESLRNRLAEVLTHWRGNDAPQVLGGVEDLDHAVACGAAYYGWAKHHGGLRIRGGTARSYYVGIETAGLAVPGMPRPLQALCVVPFGMEEGSAQRSGARMWD
ncbi:MAG: Hsp70 family protein [Pirellulales bacterium]